MWLIIKEKLNILDLLAHKKVGQVGNCVLCDNFSESSQHIFVDRAYRKFIWDSIKQDLQISSHQSLYLDMD